MHPLLRADFKTFSIIDQIEVNIFEVNSSILLHFSLFTFLFYVYKIAVFDVTTRSLAMATGFLFGFLFLLARLASFSGNVTVTGMSLV